MGRRNTGRQPSKPVQVGQGRITDLDRSCNTREQQYTVLVTTNGEGTERDYIEALVREPWVSNTIVRKKVKLIKGDPKYLVQCTARTKNEIEFDHAYAVADTDEYEVDEARKAAERLGIRLLVSNPCFEVWLTLHYVDCAAYLNNARHAIRQLKRYLPHYEKNNIRYAADFSSRVDEAVARAKKCKEAPETNPSSTMWILVEGLRNPHAYHESAAVDAV